MRQLEGSCDVFLGGGYIDILHYFAKVSACSTIFLVGEFEPLNFNP